MKRSRKTLLKIRQIELQDPTYVRRPYLSKSLNCHLEFYTQETASRLRISDTKNQHKMMQLLLTFVCTATRRNARAQDWKRCKNGSDLQMETLHRPRNDRCCRKSHVICRKSHVTNQGPGFDKSSFPRHSRPSEK